MATPSAPLLKIDASQIKATYNIGARFLELTAKGEESPFLLPPFFQKEVSSAEYSIPSTP
jgi:hypothetical protein